MTADESDQTPEAEDDKKAATGPEAAEPDKPVDLVARSRSVFVGCTLVVVVIAGLLADDVARSAGQYGSGAWVGVVLSAVAILGLAIVYLLCALNRLELTVKLAAGFTVFHLTAVLLVFGIGADVLIPDRDTGGLALLLPWGITYWLHSLQQQQEKAGKQ